MSERPRRLEVTGGSPQAPNPGRSLASICPMTGITIPECSCKRCVEELIRHHSPALLDRRFGNQRQSGRRAA